MAAAGVQFKTCLMNVCGFSDEAATYVMQTITSVEVFMQMPFDTMDSLIKHISQEHFFPVAIAPAAPLIMPLPACQSLRRFVRGWITVSFVVRRLTSLSLRRTSNESG